MGLFNSLLRLFPDSVPQENFFTEIVAYLFRANPELLEAWVKHFNLGQIDKSTIVSIRTQHPFERLEGQDVSSRVDMTINLTTGYITDTIFIEAKISSKEGKDQLRRYAEQLAQLPSNGNKILIYITRDDEHPRLDYLDAKVNFRHLHWYEFHRFLQEQPYNPIIQELVVFMKETTEGNKRLGLDNRLTSQDVLIMSPIPRDVLAQALLGPVRARFAEVIGLVQDYSLEDQQMMVAQWGNYILYYGMEFYEWRCWIGYQFEFSGERKPVLQLMIQVTPQAVHRHQIIRAMQDICQRPGWNPDDLDQHTWSGVYKYIDIPDHASGQDAVEKIQAQFLILIDELAEIKKQYPYLPWGDE